MMSAMAERSSPVFERLTREYLAGTLDLDLVAVPDLRLAQPDDVIRLADCAEFAGDGADLVRSGGFAAVILAGGMATRFSGTAKAAVEIAPGWPMLRIKLAQLAELARSLDVRLPVCVLVSEASRATVEGLLDGAVDRDLLAVTTPCQSMLPRLRPTGEVVRDATGAVSCAPPGHGEVFAVLRSQVLPRPELGDVACFMVSNIDNVVASPAVELIGARQAGDTNLVEVTAARPHERGGLVVQADGAGTVRIVEDFRLAGATVDAPKLLSTNTFYLAASTIRDGVALPYYPVAKSVDGEPVVQFEQLLCDVGRTQPLRPVLVDSTGPTSRYIPLKTTEALTDARPHILQTLHHQGLDLSAS
jgi:UTP--glucose-1-phosphate uridylyltransferase